MRDEITTAFNNKDVHWQVDSPNISKLDDNAVEFSKVILKQKDAQTYDMSV